MRDIELEYGEAYVLQDDDDENIDPDKDFSYIDKKIENVLGHYQKDFMGGLSAESLGARYGGYGSFLPMQQRSPPILSNQRTQSHLSSKSPQNLPSERSHQNSSVAANHSLSVKPDPDSSDNSMQARSESGISSMNNQFKLQGAAECASEWKSLKLRVKMTAENVASHDNSAIYSGLGLDVSPASSLEGSPSDYEGTSPDMQEMKPGSASSIIKIMTTFPLPNGELLSPLHGSLVCLMGKENNNHSKSKVKDPNKDRKSNQKEKERKLKEKVQSVKPVELVENNEYLANSAVSGIDARPEEMELASMTDRSAGSKPSGMSVKRSEVGCSEEDISNSMQQVWVARDKVEDVNTLRRRSELDKSAIPIMRRESGTNKRNEVACREDELNKQQSVQKDKVKEGVLNSIRPKRDSLHRNQNGNSEKISKDKEVGFVSMKGIDQNDKRDNIYEEMKNYNVTTLEPSNQKTHMIVMTKKRSRESQTDGICTENGTIVKDSIPSRYRRVEIDLQREMRKDNNVAGNMYPIKKRKDANSKDFVMGFSEIETSAITSKQKEKSSSKIKGFASKIGFNNEEDLVGGNYVMEKVPVVNLPVAEIVPHDNWVHCDKCQKWRLLPLGTDTESLPKEWICSMLTWLPEKNHCSFSEDETNDALRALYQPLVPTQVQNNQQAYPDGSAFVGASSGALNVGLPGQATTVDAIAGGDKRRNLLKTQADAARRSSFQEHVSVKMDLQHSSEFSNSRNQKKLPRDSNAVRKSGDVKPSKFEKKREADFEVSGVPKKMNRVHQRSMENPDLVGLQTVEAKGENVNNDHGALAITQDFAKSSKSTLKKVKDRTQNAIITKDSEMKDLSGKNRKLKDRREHITSTEEKSCRVQHPLKNCIIGKNSGMNPKEEKKERKSKASNFEGAEFSIDKGNGKTHGYGGKSSEKAIVLGLADNATTSSSSKISCKFKAKASKVKCSSIGFISSSTFRVPKSDPDKGTNKIPISYKEPDHISLRHPRPAGNMSGYIEASSSMKKDSFHRSAKTALKEATDLRISADRLKFSGSSLESTEVFFQAALKFLHGATLLEPGNSVSGRCGEMTLTEVYSTTATLCQYCAHEYEKRNNLASAALAYKCMEVAYMRVVYCNDLAASRDRTVLEMAVSAAPQVESPSSSASDIDNLNNQAATDTVKDGHSAVHHVIAAQNRPNFICLLKFTEDISRAMEASRRSQSAFAAASPVLAQAGNEKGISVIKSVLDFSFHDVDGLLHLVRLAMEALS